MSARLALDSPCPLAGNIEFNVSADGEKALIKNQPQVDHIASLLCVNAANLAKSLQCKNIGGTREVIYVNYNLAQASDARDGLAKVSTRCYRLWEAW